MNAEVFCILVVDAYCLAIAGSFNFIVVCFDAFSFEILDCELIKALASFYIARQSCDFNHNFVIFIEIWVDIVAFIIAMIRRDFKNRVGELLGLCDSQKVLVCNIT